MSERHCHGSFDVYFDYFVGVSVGFGVLQRAGNKRPELIVKRISSFSLPRPAAQCRDQDRRRQWRQCGVRNQKSDSNLNGFRVAGRDPEVPRPEQIGTPGLLYLLLRSRARNDPFPREALLFYEGVKEARALPSSRSDAGRSRFEVLEIHKTFGAFISDRSSSRDGKTVGSV